MGGLYLNTTHVLRPRTRITIVISFASGPVWHRAEVVWAISAPATMRRFLESGMAVKFLDVKPDWPEFLAKWEAARVPTDGE